MCNCIQFNTNKHTAFVQYSATGVAIRQGLHSLGIEIRYGRHSLHLFRPGLRPTPCPVKCVGILFAEGKTARAWRSTLTLSIAVVKESVDLNLYSRSGVSWPRLVRPSSFTTINKYAKQLTR